MLKVNASVLVVGIKLVPKAARDIIGINHLHTVYLSKFPLSKQDLLIVFIVRFRNFFEKSVWRTTVLSMEIPGVSVLGMLLTVKKVEIDSTGKLG